jgi:hypothetical protein
MSIDNILSAMQGVYGVAIEDDTSTVRGLLRFCRRWLNGEVTAEELHNPCWEMSGRLRHAAEATFADLDRNPNLCEEVKEPILVTGEAYEAIVSILGELPILAAQNQRTEFEEALEEFEAERLAVLEATEEINAQMSGREARCPRCGQSGGERCKDCGLVLLFPDPKQLQDSSYRAAPLSPVHVRVYNTLASVKEGKSSLETLSATLPPLSAHLRELGRFCDRATPDQLPPELLPSLRRSISVAQQGVERLGSVSSTRRVSDLNRGWEDIFEASLAISADLARAGSTTASLQSEPSPRSDGFSP